MCQTGALWAKGETHKRAQIPQSFSWMVGEVKQGYLLLSALRHSPQVVTIHQGDFCVRVCVCVCQRGHADPTSATELMAIWTHWGGADAKWSLEIKMGWRRVVRDHLIVSDRKLFSWFNMHHNLKVHTLAAEWHGISGSGGRWTPVCCVCVCVCGLVFLFLTNNAPFNWRINTTKTTKICRCSYKLLQEGHSEVEFHEATHKR